MNNHDGGGDVNLPNSKTSQKATVIFKVSYYWKKKEIDQRYRIRSSETDTCVNERLVYKKCDMQINTRKMGVPVTFYVETHHPKIH